nr:hypothetical protein [Thermoanaerobaculia bacterium]
MNLSKRFTGGTFAPGFAALSFAALGFAALVGAAAPALASGPGTVKFDQSSISVLEEAGVALVLVERSQGEDGAITVDYSSGDVSATAGADYEAVTGTLSWAAGDGSSRTITVPILDDAAGEPGESLVLALSNATGGATIDPTRS